MWTAIAALTGLLAIVHRKRMIRAFDGAIVATTQAVLIGLCFATIPDPPPELATGLLTMAL
ncbi:hypothetical protein OAN307_c17070 [Octadecabacter antarcticus 307]|uniref:Uncharacterized protein n=2 Tax=Octadecabacter TaxID=53945 RepID=M9R408_9RHOB|nr:hypothetical protein OAN307_c17070 [Octadecabacter antarcticus 307]